MSTTLIIRDETVTGDVMHSTTLEFPSETITIRELIRERVYQEVQDYNVRAVNSGAVEFNGLVRPHEIERRLNAKPSQGFAGRVKREIDWKKQFKVACDAFGRNGFFILVDNRQAERLDEQVTIGHGTQVSFVKLVQLVGG